MSGRGAGRAVLDTLRRHVETWPPAQPVVVAFSGGLDSSVLLHALRFGCGAGGSDGPGVIAAHFDHAMRAGSAADAAWAAGVCRAWGVPFRSERSETVLRSEAEARAARYAFLDHVREAVGSEAPVITAHHADDQAETILFRAVRGTGPDGLMGIAARGPGRSRPLLDLWRDDLEAYAADVGLRWRVDPTNEALGPARNALRHEVIPLIERHVAPTARRALVRLGRIAGADAEAWAEILPMLCATLEMESVAHGSPGSAGRVSVDRTRVSELGPGLRSRVLRHLAGEVGLSVDSATLARVDDFIASSTSGRRIELEGGGRVALEPDRVVFVGSGSPRHPTPSADDEEVLIEDDGEGCGVARLAGHEFRVAWSEAGTDGATDGATEGEASAPSKGRSERTSLLEATFDRATLDFPLRVRARAPGDRLLRNAGTSKVKKILLEHRIPVDDRGAVPLLVDAEDRVLWIPGIARSAAAMPRPHAPTLTIRIG